ncbi:MAG: VCBS repeat-containing protein [Pseudomonadota bacterium]
MISRRVIVDCVVLFTATVFAPTCFSETISLWGTEFVSQSIDVAANQKSLVFADLNGDSLKDLVVAHDDRDELAVFLGNAAGNFTRSRQYAAGENPADLAVGDIDADGHLDIVVTNHETSYLTLLLGNGRGGVVAAPHGELAVNVDPHPHVTHIVDLNNDDIFDLLVDHRNERGLLAIEGLGNGAFDKKGVFVPMGGDPYLGMAVGDINGDGLPDIATPNSNDVGIALNTSSDDFSFDLLDPVRVASPFAIAFADINADSIPDLVVASNGAVSAVEVLIGDGKGAFTRLGDTVTMQSGAKNLAIGDFDGDGRDDILATSWSSDAVVIRCRSTALETARVSFKNFRNLWGVALTDINNDGVDDFVIADGVQPLASVYVSVVEEATFQLESEGDL